ncbi:MAG: ATP-binding protein [Pseudonocardiaceae bacterium]
MHRRAALERRLDPFSFTDARAFLPRLAAAEYVEAFAACGGYPLHLQRWDPGASPEETLHELAFTPGGLLLRDALDILSEDLDWRGGYERVLGALGAGTRRRSRIASRAQQRIDYTLGRLRQAGYVRAVRPHGSPPTTDPLYEITDPYLAFWFAVLREDADLVEGGQGQAVQRRVRERWQAHLGRVFEEAAREHAVRLVGSGEFPAEMTVGRWWRDKLATVGGADNPAQIDVLGLPGERTRLVGEARWQNHPLSLRDLQALRAKLSYLPEPHRDVEFALWSRGGRSPAVSRESSVRLFTCADMT